MKTGVPSEVGEASATGAVSRLAGWVAVAVGLGLGPGAGPMVGNKLAALPAPTSKLASPFSAGMGPSGSTAMCSAALGAAVAELFAAAAAAATVVVSAAAGGVHFVVVTTLAVAVSITELTEVAFDATAICAFRLMAFVVTELRLHEAVPSLAHPLLNVGFWLDGCAVSATDTSAAVPFLVDTLTT